MAKINLQTLLDAGAHFGHQTRRWNPKMRPYIFGNRGDIYILDLKQTLVGLDQAYTCRSPSMASSGAFSLANLVASWTFLAVSPPAEPIVE